MQDPAATGRGIWTEIESGNATSTRQDLYSPAPPYSGYRLHVSRTNLTPLVEDVKVDDWSVYVR